MKTLPIPAWLLASEEPSSAQKLIYALLLFLPNEGTVEAPHQMLAETLGMPLRRVQYGIAELKRIGWIAAHDDYRPAQVPRYTLLKKP